jgi:hypothetical protein
MGWWDLKPLLGSTDMEIVKPEKLGYVPLTPRHWAMHHQLLPHGRWRKFFGLGGTNWAC